MIGKKINQLATELAPASTDLTIIGNPTTGVSKKITLAQLGAIFSGAVSFYTNYASFPATGTLDVIFCAKDTQKLYLWSGSAYVEVFPSQALLDTYQLRSEKGNANGYASLDSSGKVPVSQLPSSIMEYKGTWSAATNTPTLANGTGDTGDVYICNAAGSVNFGAGSITFAVGDYVIYSGSIWQRSSGAVGTVTSVAASITGNAIGITGSPVTTSGTLAFAFAGTGAQYIKGDGTLATFPSIISQAQNLITEVYNSTGATLTKGTVVYINGGQGNLPTVTKAIATGDSTSAQTFGIVQADITNNNNGFVVIAGKLSDIDTQAYTAGTQLYLSSTTAGAYTSTKQYAPAHLVYVGIIVRSHPTQGVIEVKIQNGYELDELHNVSAQTPTNNDGLFYESSTSLWKNKSLSTILGGSPAYGSGTQNRITKFTANAGELINSNIHDTGSVIYNNNPSDGQFAWQFNGSQTTGLSYGALIVAGTNASDIALRIQNASSTSEYFFVWGDGRVQINNIPNATTDTDRFLVSDSGVIKYRTGTQLLSDIGGQAAINGTGFVKASGTTISYDNSTYLTTSAAASTYLPLTGGTISGNLSITTLSGVVYADATGQLGTTSGTQDTIAYWGSSRSIASLSTSTYPSLTELSYVKGVTSSIQTQLNAKQNTLTNPVTGTGTTNYLPKFTGTSTIGNSNLQDDGTNILTSLAYKSTANSNTFGNASLSGRSLILQAGSSNQAIMFKNAAGGDATLYITGTSTSVNYQFDTYSVGGAMTLTNSGNLGLGVTPSAWGSGARALQLGTRMSVYNDGFNNALFGNNTYFNGSDNYYISTAAAARFYIETSGSFIWQNAPSGTAGNAISFTQAMTLNASGNLSIGNTNDTYKLDVNGTGRFTGSVTAASGTFSQSSGITTIIQSDWDRSATNNTQLYIRGNTNTNKQLRIGYDTAGNVGYIQALTSGTGVDNLLINPSGGSVGIGTTSPSVALQVDASGGGIIRATRLGAGSAYIQLEADGTNGTLTSSAALIMNAGGSERMRISSGGKVCINTTTVNNGAFLNIGSSGSSRGDDLMTIFNPAVYGIRFLSATGGGSPNTSIAHMLLGNDGTTGRSINASGTINASGADYAEYMTKAVSENIAKGDIIGVDANGLLTNIYADAISFVVKSTDPSYVGGDKWGADLTGVELETARQKVDRVAFSGQVPCNVLNAQVGDYIIPINVNGKIKGEAVTTPTFEQYQISVGKVWKIMEDGRAWIAIKIG